MGVEAGWWRRAKAVQFGRKRGVVYVTRGPELEIVTATQLLAATYLFSTRFGVARWHGATHDSTKTTLGPGCGCWSGMCFGIDRYQGGGSAF